MSLEGALNVALVVPTHNDTAGLNGLLAHTQGLFSEVIIVDDGSDPPVEMSAHAPGTTLIRHPVAQGPGPARNAGLAAVTAPYVMFFDADDQLTDELSHLLADLASAAPFDLCLFQHADSRILAEPRWGPPDWDQRLWDRAGASLGALRPAPDQARPILAQTTNYPWNKIARTDFLRAHDICCAETTVHQDAALHWRAIICADSMLTSDRVCALHHVTPGAARLTNRTGPERLQLFQAFAPVGTEAAVRGPVWQAALTAYVMVLTDWAAELIDPALRVRLREMERDWLRDTALPWLDGIAKTDPDTAQLAKDRAG